MCPSDHSDDELIFLAEDTVEPTQVKGEAWNILIVDDDEEIHTVTKLALSDLTLDNKHLEFYHAYSGKEAIQTIKEMGSKIAIVLLDVVMETDDAGLQVARQMRRELKLDEPRIILRTGQPGYAPEDSVIKDYDINDYKTKTELTRSKLVTTMIASLRSYQQIVNINLSRVGLQKIIVLATQLLEQHSVKDFCEGVVTQICSLVDVEPQGIVCARAGSLIDKDDNGIYVIGAAGEFIPHIEKKLNELPHEHIKDFVVESLQSGQHIYEDEFSVFFLKSSGFEAAVYLPINSKISDLNKSIFEVFMSVISVGYENVNLFHQLNDAAYRDWLTKLPNRSEFLNILDGMESSQNKADKAVVALVDIDHFADINDGLGQETGNKTLLVVAERLSRVFGENVTKSRIGSDVFGLFGPESLVNPKTLQELFVSPFKAGDHTLPLSATFGLCRMSADISSGNEFLKRSNIALNIAKKSLNTNFEYYAPEMEEQTTWRLEMIRQLRVDFDAQKLQLWYQPQFDLVSERIVGMEALLRWPSSDGGFISPAVFVPLAEYSGLIIDIGAWVLREACEKLKMLIDLGQRDLRMAINISMPQFRDPAFISNVKNTILKHDLRPENVELEITESVVMDEPQIVIDALRELKEFGVKVAIDDFGTGFSSMSYLQQLPLDRLKVDRSFVNEIVPGKAAFIAETIVTLGSKLGLQTIAEGVEKREQASYMLKLGCDEAQGYLFAKPMPFEQLLEFIQKH